jgi:hypothetical protein
VRADCGALGNHVRPHMHVRRRRGRMVVIFNVDMQEWRF